MAKIWYVSDWHLWHYNIINFCGRPFDDEQQMNEKLIAYHNELVKPEDHVWNLGDVVMWAKATDAARDKFVNTVKRFNGRKRLLLGNHDHLPMSVYSDAGFEKIQSTHQFEGFLFSHIPIHPASLFKARACVHGHIHNNQGTDFPTITRKVAADFNHPGREGVVKVPYINVSVEVINYRPVEFDQLVAKVKEAGGC